MNKLVISLFSVIVLTVVVQFVFINGAYSNIECGTQKWVLKVLFFDFGEPPMDEYGISERWSCAHEKKCGNEWERKALGSGDSNYWPKLHLSVAKGTSIEVLKNNLEQLDEGELEQRDALGRSVLHWMAVHSNKKGSIALFDSLSASVDLTQLKDNDGLTPKDWLNSCQ